MTTAVKATLTQVDRLKNTHSGNPMFVCHFTCADGTTFLARTLPNSQFSYAVTNHVGQTHTYLFRMYRGEWRLYDTMKELGA